eukprot:279878-Chlamydomonas_euryale.AAC.5
MLLCQPRASMAALKTESACHATLAHHGSLPDAAPCDAPTTDRRPSRRLLIAALRPGRPWPPADGDRQESPTWAVIGHAPACCMLLEWRSSSRPPSVPRSRASQPSFKSFLAQRPFLGSRHALLAFSISSSAVYPSWRHLHFPLRYPPKCPLRHPQDEAA